MLVAATGTKFGFEGLLLTILMTGVMLTLVGFLRLGSLIRPHSSRGYGQGLLFAWIAVTILASQPLKFGRSSNLTLPPEPVAVATRWKLAVLFHALPTLNPAASAVGVGSAVLIFFLRRFRPSWPGMLIAVATASVAGTLFHLPIETIGSRFGGLPHGIPLPSLPVITLPLLLQMLPSAFSFTLLGGVESLLSAKVADSMTGRRHRSNMELVAQGIANIASACFGGISVTGNIARTATNIRAGARSPVSGMMHSIFLLLFILVAAPLASFVPLGSLAGVLLVVCWNMAEKKEFWRLLGYWREATVLIATFALTLIKDLTVGIIAGCALAALFALLRRGVTEEGE